MSCGCKGIRSCLKCEGLKTESIPQKSPEIVFIYCNDCRQAVRIDFYENNSKCPHKVENEHTNDPSNVFPIDGIYLIADFIDEKEETELVNEIDQDLWIPSQSGRLKQDFGVKVNFKKQIVKYNMFTGMPSYAQMLIERIKKNRFFQDFQAVELCNLDYVNERGSSIDPHIDNTWIWGERLVTLNLLSDTIICLTNNEIKNSIVYIPLPRRWLFTLYSDARYDYMHSIQRQHIQSRRVAITLREFVNNNEKLYIENTNLCEKIIEISKRFTGLSVGRLEEQIKQYQHQTNDIERMDDVDVQTSPITRLNDILKSEYGVEIFTTKLLDSYYLNETILITSSDNIKYIAKLMHKTKLSYDNLKYILLFQNYLYESCNYPCSKVLLSTSKNSLITLIDTNYYLFLQTYIDGNEPSIDVDENYYKQMGSLLAQWRLNYCTFFSCTNVIHDHIEEEFTDDWWHSQYICLFNTKYFQINEYRRNFLLSNLYNCQQKLKQSHIITDKLQRGLIHNDFHTNNTLYNNNENKMFVMDFLDAKKSYFLADIANALFHLFVHTKNEQHLKLFINGYCELFKLEQDELDLIDLFIRLKLTVSLICDVSNENIDQNDNLEHSNTFIDDCFCFLEKLSTNLYFVKQLFH